MKRHRRPLCSFCHHEGHNVKTCKYQRLAIWSNGCELWIAESAAEAARLEVEFMETFVSPELAEGWIATPAEGWHRLQEEPLELMVNEQAENWPQRTWILANGAGPLAHDGAVLAPGRKSPAA